MVLVDISHPLITYIHMYATDKKFNLPDAHHHFKLQEITKSDKILLEIFSMTFEISQISQKDFTFKLKARKKIIKKFQLESSLKIKSHQ